MRLLQNDRDSVFGYVHRYAPSTSPSILRLTKNLRRELLACIFSVIRQIARDVGSVMYVNTLRSPPRFNLSLTKNLLRDSHLYLFRHRSRLLQNERSVAFSKGEKVSAKQTDEDD